MNYWLLKSEPDCYSIDDLKKDKVGVWSGVRNFQARNFLREMKEGDLALFYHSSCKITGIYGLGKIVKEAYPDPTQFVKSDDHFDPKSKKENPTWVAVNVEFMEKFTDPLPLSLIKENPKLSSMRLNVKGDRLSVHPVLKKDFEYIVEKCK